MKHEANGNGFVRSFGFLQRERVCVLEPHLDKLQASAIAGWIFFGVLRNDLPVTYSDGNVLGLFGTCPAVWGFGAILCRVPFFTTGEACRFG